MIEALDLSFLSKFGFIFIFLITASLKTYCMSAIGGGILEIASGEDLVFRVRGWNLRAKKFWQGFLAVIVMVSLVDFFLFVPIASLRPWRPVYFSLAAMTAAYVLARWAIHQKYIRPLGIPRRMPRLGASFWLVAFLACFWEVMAVKGLALIHTGNFKGQNIESFILNYIHVFEFIFCSLYILDDHPEIKEKFNSSKEIFLVNPIFAGPLNGIVFWFTRSYPPFFVVLKALSPKTYKFREFDQVIWQDRYYKSKVLVCITCFTSNSYEAYKIAKEFRKRGATVVMGGPHVTFFPQEALAFCDSVIIGPAEGVWSQVVRDHENGMLKEQYKGCATEADFQQVHEELLSSPPYVIKEFLETMRGCKFQCHFCTIPAIGGGQVRTQPINDVIELIKKVRPYYKSVVFVDNNIYADPGYAKELFVALKPLKIKWNSECSIDIGKNEEILKLARESGCRGLGIGYEISGQSSEKDQGGKFAMAQKFREYTKNIKKQGINIKAQFIFGFDSDNLRTLFQLWKFCFSIMPNKTVVSLLTPLPGSVVYREMLAQDRIINLNWRNYNCQSLVIRHPQLNHALVSYFFIFINLFFLTTTSTIGFLLLALAVILPTHGAGNWIFR
jgi:radical SAM superfamily enzyme YgiQ (UPF0313 family)